MKIETYKMLVNIVGWTAIQFDGRNWKDLLNFSNGMLMEKTTSIFGNYSKESIKISTDSNQLVSISEGNYLIKSSVTGKYYEIKPELLEQHFINVSKFKSIEGGKYE